VIASFTVDVRPVPKGRPRLGKHGNVYTPTPTVAFENHIAVAAMQSRLPYGIAAPIATDMMFWIAQRDGDLDNYVKAVLDGLRAFFNDKQVWKLTARFADEREMQLRDGFEGVDVEVQWDEDYKPPASATSARSVDRKRRSRRFPME